MRIFKGEFRRSRLANTRAPMHSPPKIIRNRKLDEKNESSLSEGFKDTDTEHNEARDLSRATQAKQNVSGSPNNPSSLQVARGIVSRNEHSDTRHGKDDTHQGVA